MSFHLPNEVDLVQFRSGTMVLFRSVSMSLEVSGFKRCWRPMLSINHVERFSFDKLINSRNYN